MVLGLTLASAGLDLLETIVKMTSMNAPQTHVEMAPPVITESTSSIASVLTDFKDLLVRYY